METMHIDEIINVCSGKVFNYKAEISIFGISTDSRKISEGDLFIPIKGESFDGHQFINSAFEKGAALALSSIEIDTESPYILVDDTVNAMHQITKYYKAKFKIPFVALTGSSGKTTTKEMIWSVLSQKYNTLKTEGNYNNAIGLPITVFNLNHNHEIAILEMGMNSPGEIRTLVDIVKPDVAVITNVGTAHIENLGSRENILKAKCEIFTYFDKNNTAVINGDNDMLSLIKDKEYSLIKYGINEGNTYQAKNIIEDGENGISFELNVSDRTERFFVPLPGMHNVYNALAAIIIGIMYDVDIDRIKTGLSSFRPAKMRMDIFTLKDDVKVINDVYNANPDSMVAAIDVLNSLKSSRRSICVLGDMLELGSISQQAHYNIGSYVAKSCTDILVTVGTLAKNIAKGALESGMDKKCIKICSTNQEAINELNYILAASDIALVKGSRGMKMEQIIDFLRERG